MDGNGIAAIDEAELDNDAVGLVEINLLRQSGGLAQAISIK